MQYQTIQSFHQKEVKVEGIHPNLVHERKQCDFNQEQLSEILWSWFGSKEGLKTFRKLSKTFANDPILRNQPNYCEMEREELIEEGYKKLSRINEVMPGFMDYRTAGLAAQFINGGVSTNFLSLFFQLSVSLHHMMFELTVRYLGDDEQVKDWLPQISKYQMIGSYSQTEIGHGSNVRVSNLFKKFSSLRDS